MRFGMLWGLGNLTFGLSIRYLGMALGYWIALGSCTVARAHPFRRTGADRNAELDRRRRGR